jgi:hypothetical protein
MRRFLPLIRSSYLIVVSSSQPGQPHNPGCLCAAIISVALLSGNTLPGRGRISISGSSNTPAIRPRHPLSPGSNLDAAFRSGSRSEISVVAPEAEWVSRIRYPDADTPSRLCRPPVGETPQTSKPGGLSDTCGTVSPPRRPPSHRSVIERPLHVQPVS